MPIWVQFVTKFHFFSNLRVAHVHDEVFGKDVEFEARRVDFVVVAGL